LKNIYKSLIAVSAAFIGVYAFLVYGFLELGIAVHPIMKENFKAHPLGIYVHIFPSLLALILGPFQFNTTFRNHKIHIHRFIGKIYLLCVLIGGLSGLYMAQFSFGGMISHSGFGLLALLWLFTGYKAYTSIIRKQIHAHYNWMVINFALSFAAVTLRLGLGIGFASGIPFETFYPFLAWLCWIPNFLVALIWVKQATASQAP
jgi:hypothetical protein